jgi:Protein of unknown function (DUF4019)
MQDIHGQDGSDVIWASTFGVVFLATVLAIALFVKRPTPLLVTVVKIVLALAGSGVAATVPGFLELSLQQSHLLMLRAGGAIAVFVILFFFVPAGLVGHTEDADDRERITATGDPELVASSWLSLIDRREYAKAWAETVQATQIAYPRSLFDRLYVEQVEPLGEALSRSILGAATAVVLPNGNRGNYRMFKYRTRFANDNGLLRDEEVVVKAEQGVWKVENHNVSPQTVKPA